MIKKIAILGFGREGKSVLKFLTSRSRMTRIKTLNNAEIWILDKNNIKISNPENIKFQIGENYLKNLDQFDIVYRSPGIPYNLPEIQKAIKKGVHPHTKRGLVPLAQKKYYPRYGVGVKFSSATELFFEQLHRLTQNTHRPTQKKVRVDQRLVRVSPRPLVIGITGTKGKGTTATLLYKILKACGKQVYLAGNIGKPALDILKYIHINQPNQHKSASPIIILELSSFQLQDLNYSPNIAVVLDIFPDHLDAHKNFKEYFEAKANIAKWQKKTNKIFYFSGNRYSKLIAKKSPGKKIPVNPSFSNSRELENKIKSVIKIPGTHNLKNAIMAATVALSLNCPKEKIIKIVKNFRGNEHRLELVRTIETQTSADLTQTHAENFRVVLRSIPRRSAIYWYNDSASTNPQAAAAAVRAFKEPKVLIVGGKDKGLNYSPLASALKNSNTRLVILFGENKKKIYKAISGQRLAVREVKTLKDAVNLAYKTAKNLLKSIVNSQRSKVIILFSPASTSFDMFKDYADRGEKFKELVRKLK